MNNKCKLCGEELHEVVFDLYPKPQEALICTNTKCENCPYDGTNDLISIDEALEDLIDKRPRK